jgi:hypothetical protein
MTGGLCVAHGQLALIVQPKAGYGDKAKAKMYDAAVFPARPWVTSLSGGSPELKYRLWN